MSEITSIRVDYKNVEGWHVFTSEELPGLYVASQDPELAYNDVGTALEKLIELDTGATCRVSPEVPFSEFLRFQQRHEERMPRPTKLATHRYAVACA